MGLRIDKAKKEFEDWADAPLDWWDEVVRQNGPRYLVPREWAHLVVDFFGASFQLIGRTFDRLHYTLAHVVAVAIPLYGVVSLYQWVTG